MVKGRGGGGLSATKAFNSIKMLILCFLQINFTEENHGRFALLIKIIQVSSARHSIDTHIMLLQPF